MYCEAPLYVNNLSLALSVEVLPALQFNGHLYGGHFVLALESPRLGGIKAGQTASPLTF